MPYDASKDLSSGYEYPRQYSFRRAVPITPDAELPQYTDAVQFPQAGTYRVVFVGENSDASTVDVTIPAPGDYSYRIRQLITTGSTTTTGVLALYI